MSDPQKSYRVCFWVEVEVSADDPDSAVKAAEKVIHDDNYDKDQLTMEDVIEVDPLTGCEVDAHG